MLSTAEIQHNQMVKRLFAVWSSDQVAKLMVKTTANMGVSSPCLEIKEIKV